jgi:hypothetical protein
VKISYATRCGFHCAKENIYAAFRGSVNVLMRQIEAHLKATFNNYLPAVFATSFAYSSDLKMVSKH